MLENVLDAEAAGATVANHAARRGARSAIAAGASRGASLVDAETGDALRDPRARRRQRDRPVHRQLSSPTGAAPPAPDAGRAPGVRRRPRPARRPRPGAALAARQPPVLRAARRRAHHRRHDRHRLDAVGTREPPRLDDDIRARGDDVAYLLEAANHAFPALRLGADDVLSTFAGLRPLLATSAHTPSETSREHEIARDADGLLVIAGGKLTTLRRMGEQAVDRAVERCAPAASSGPLDRCATADRPLPGGGRAAAALAEAGLGPTSRARLAAAYGGARRERAATRRRVAASSRGRIDPELPYLWAEVVHAVRAEHARDVADVLRRRIPLFRDARDQGLAAAARVADDPGRRARLDAGAPRRAPSPTTAPPSSARAAGATSAALTES